MNLYPDGNSMSEIPSPFMSCIVQCRSKMKRLRKKIYKNLKARQHSSALRTPKSKEFSIQNAVRTEKLPSFLASIVKQLKKEEGLKDITNFSLEQKVNFVEIRGYADGQEKEVELMLQTMHQRTPKSSFEDMQSDEEISTLNRLKSRQWLQSTEMEYEDEQMMERHSKITLKPFQLFSNSQESQQVLADNPYDSANEMVGLQSDNLFQQNLFQF